jgi:hypothetical protein
MCDRRPHGPAIEKKVCKRRHTLRMCDRRPHGPAIEKKVCKRHHMLRMCDRRPMAGDLFFAFNCISFYAVLLLRKPIVW